MNNDKNNVLVTGCAGFIGSHAVDLFLDRGHKVFGIDSMTYASDMSNMTSALSHKDGSFQFSKTDIRETEAVSDICQKNNIGWIFNFAAETHVDNSITDITPFIESNIKGVQSLLRVCQETGVRLFQISTDEVYGSVETGSSLETDTLDPRNPYSATKAAAEHLITSFANTYGVEYLIVRPSNNFGPRQNFEKFLPTILKKLSEDKKIPVYGDGKNIRDWLFVKDNVRIIYDIWKKSQTSEVYNISLIKEMTNIELVKNVCSVYEKDWKESVSFVEDRLGHDKRYSVNPSKATQITDVEATPFSKALRETIAFYHGEKLS